MQTINTDPNLGITAMDGRAYFSLGSSLWSQLTGGHGKETYTYSPPGQPWPSGEMGTMTLKKWDDDWYSAKLRLERALGFGTYEQSITVGKGAGMTTTFYLCEHDRDGGKGAQEIDFEFSGNCNPQQNPCGTQFVHTNVWRNSGQSYQHNKLWSGNPPHPLPDSTAHREDKAYRYKLVWEPDHVEWFVDRRDRGTGYESLRRHNMSQFGYREDLLYPFISFWKGWSPDDSPFCPATPDTVFQAYYYESLAFTPSKNNRITQVGA
jgi:hypothetical protein